MKNFGPVFWVAIIACAFSGCRSFSARVVPGRNLTSYQRFFVKSNLNDNHGLDEAIVKALQAHGLTAEAGPLTMMPHDTQALITFDDAWSWDFKYHLVGLTLGVSDVHAEKQIGEANYSGPAAMMTTPFEVIDQLVEKLLKSPSKAPATFQGTTGTPANKGEKGGRHGEKQTTP